MFNFKRKLIHLRNKVFGIPEKGDLVKGVWVDSEQVYLVLDAYKVGEPQGPFGARCLNLVVMNLNTNAVIQVYWSSHVTVMARAEDPQSPTW
jgi:hypothetical protein